MGLMASSSLAAQCIKVIALDRRLPVNNEARLWCRNNKCKDSKNAIEEIRSRPMTVALM